MSQSHSPDNKSTGCQSIATSANQFVEAVTTSLEEHTTIPEEEVAEIREAGESLSRDIQELEEEAEELREDVDSHDAKLSDHLESIVSLEIEIEEHLEHHSPDANPGGNGEETTLHRPESPLERIVSLPEHMIESELSSNQQRARFIAMDVLDYAKKVPAGRSIDSPTIKKILKARDGKTPHSQTVARVMDFLDRFGRDGTTLVKRRGTKRIVFTEDCVDRLSKLSNDQEEITPVVRGKA